MIVALDQVPAVIDDRSRHRGPPQPHVPSHRRHRMPVSADPAAGLLAGPLGPRRARRDRWMGLSSGLLLTFGMHTAPDPLDPHQMSPAGLQRADHAPTSGVDHAGGPAPRTPGTTRCSGSFRSHTSARRHRQTSPTRPFLPTRASPSQTPTTIVDIKKISG